MATVELTFTPLPAHVRTARLIATAVARRSGVAESLLDEVRLAVGEACSRAVEAHSRHCPQSPIRLELSEGSGRFEVVVTDSAPGDLAAPSSVGPSPAPYNGGLVDPYAASFGLAVIAGLADDLEVSPAGEGTQVRMSWPITGPAGA